MRKLASPFAGLSSVALAVALLPAVVACKVRSESTVASTSQAPADPALEGNIDAIKGDAVRTVTALHARLGGTEANRQFHPKGLCAKGAFIVDPDTDNLPPELRVGLFAQKGTYPMYGRFSNGFPIRTADDHIPSVFGFGVKVMNVPGPKFAMPGSSKPQNSNQDWNMATGRTFPIPDAATYRAQREAGQDPERLRAFAAQFPEVARDLAAARSLLDTYLATSYHTQVALHFGEQYVAKFSAAPCNNGEERTATAEQIAGRSNDYLREDLRERLANEGACFDFRAQIRPADAKLSPAQASWASEYPVANPTREWSVDAIPFVKLATIRIPAQPVDAFQETCEAFSINPGNALQAFRPIETDTLMMSRFRGAYEGSVSTRTTLNPHMNGGQQIEPTVAADLTVEEWLRATR